MILSQRWWEEGIEMPLSSCSSCSPRKTSPSARPCTVTAPQFWMSTFHMSCSVNFVPDWTLCTSIKVQNNTSVFQHREGQWPLQSSARWVCILINQQGGSHSAFHHTPFEVGPGGHLPGPCSVRCGHDSTSQNTVPHPTSLPKPSQGAGYTEKRKGFKGFTGVDSGSLENSANSNGLNLNLLKTQEKKRRRTWHRKTVLTCQIPWIHIIQQSSKWSGAIKDSDVVRRVSTWNTIWERDLTSGRV